LISTADDVSRLTLLTHKLPLSRWRKPMQDESKRVQDGHSRMDGAVARSRALTIQTKVSLHCFFRATLLAATNSHSNTCTLLGLLMPVDEPTGD
jgi:hypothetical protein